MTKKTDFKLTQANIERLSGSKKERALALMDKVVFMESELKKLQDILRDKGWTETYQNGATQFGIKKSSEADVYNALIKNYTSALKQLEDLVPEDVAESKLDRFLNE